MSEGILINPDGHLLLAIANRLRETRKTKPIWANRIEDNHQVDTLEGRVQAHLGDYLCRGIIGEQWPQKESKLFEKYDPSGQLDQTGWQRFDPKPDSEPVEAVQVNHAFRVIAHCGELSGTANDYVVRSKSDPTDIWIVDKAIFEASYEVSAFCYQPTLDPKLWKKVVAEEEARDAELRKANTGKEIVISQVEAFELKEIQDEKGETQ